MERESESGSGVSSRLDELIREATAQSPEEPSSQGAGAVPPLPPPPMPDLSGLLGGLASNPELMAKLPQMISTLGPMLSGMSGGAGRSSFAPPPHGMQSSHGPHSSHGDRHTALLCAVKPYLCAERQAAADRLIQLCKMEGLLQNVSPPRPEKGGEDHV